MATDIAFVLDVDGIHVLLYGLPTGKIPITIVADPCFCMTITVQMVIQISVGLKGAAAAGVATRSTHCDVLSRLFAGL
jgi:hypothetical protein